VVQETQAAPYTRADAVMLPDDEETASQLSRILRLQTEAPHGIYIYLYIHVYIYLYIYLYI